MRVFRGDDRVDRGNVGGMERKTMRTTMKEEILRVMISLISLMWSIYSILVAVRLRFKYFRK